MNPKRLTVFLGGNDSLIFEINKLPIHPDGSASYLPIVEKITVYPAIQEIVIDFVDRREIKFYNVGHTEGLTTY